MDSPITGMEETTLPRHFYISIIKMQSVLRKHIHSVIVKSLDSADRNDGNLFLHLLDHVSVSTLIPRKLHFASRLNFSVMLC